MISQDISRLKFDAASHTYRIDGKIVPSVSQVLRLAVAPPHLHRWIRNNRGDKRAQEALKVKTELACQFGTDSHEYIETFLAEKAFAPTTEEEKNKAIKAAKKIDFQSQEYSQAVEQLADDLNKEVDKLVDGATTADMAKLDHTRSGIRFLKKHKVCPIRLELPIIGVDDEYAGTADLVGMFPAGGLVADWKTNQCTNSKFKQYKVPHYTIQMSAYCKPLEVRDAIIVHLPTGSDYHITGEELDEAYEKFKLLLDLHHGRGIHPRAKEVCELWNTGEDYQGIWRATKIGPNQIADIINYYQIH